MKASKAALAPPILKGSDEAQEAEYSKSGSEPELLPLFPLFFFGVS